MLFAVKGAFPALMVYFRPTKSIKAYIDGREAALLRQNRVVEYIKDLSVYLVQAALPEGVSRWNRFDAEIRGRNGAFGMAVIFADR